MSRKQNSGLGPRGVYFTHRLSVYSVLWDSAYCALRTSTVTTPFRLFWTRLSPSFVSGGFTLTSPARSFLYAVVTLTLSQFAPIRAYTEVSIMSVTLVSSPVLTPPS